MECWRKVCWPSLTNLGKLRLFVNLNFHVLFWVVFSHHLSSIYWNSLHVLIDGDYTSPTCVNLLDSSSPLQSSLVKLQSFTSAPIVSIYRDLCVLIYDILLGFYNSPRVSIYCMVWCLALVSLQRFSGVLILSIARCFIIKIKYLEKILINVKLTNIIQRFCSVSNLFSFLLI